MTTGGSASAAIMTGPPIPGCDALSLQRQVMLPLLRLVVGLVGALAGSNRVRAQGADFADQHAPALQRVMDDAASLGARCADLLVRQKVPQVAGLSYILHMLSSI